MKLYVDEDKIKGNITIPTEKVCDTLYEVLGKENPKNTFHITYNEKREESGWFTYTVGQDSTKKVTINMAKIRTYRDMIFSMLHEWAHVQQYDRLGGYVLSVLTTEKKSYNTIEQEADRYAFDKEKKLHYKSFVVNSKVPYSIFVERKIVFSDALSK